jgi:hypothetical protein
MLTAMKKLVLLACLLALVAASAASARLGSPARVTLDAVHGVWPGMRVAAVSGRWDVSLRLDYAGTGNICGSARVAKAGVDGFVVFIKGRLGAVFFRKGAVTGKGIRIGSTLAELQRAYPKLTSRPDKYVPGGRNYFLRRTRAPHWEVRFDVSPQKRVTLIAFGESDSVRLVEGCS